MRKLNLQMLDKAEQRINLKFSITNRIGSFTQICRLHLNIYIYIIEQAGLPTTGIKMREGQISTCLGQLKIQLILPLYF